MELTYNAEKRLYVFTTARQEQDGHGKFGPQLAGEAKLKLLGYNSERLTFATQDPFRALMLAKFGNAALVKRIQEHARLKGNELPILTHRNGVYIWTGPAMSADGKIRFRDIPKAAQFAFTKHPVRDIPRGAGEGCPSDVWWSESSLKAMKCSEYADEAAQLAIGTFIARKHNALQESRAVDADIDIPVPEGLEPKPFQRGGVAYAMKRTKVLFGDEMGLGKLSPVDTPVLTPSGWRQIGSIQLGDRVIGSDGSAKAVTGVFPQGIKTCYTVLFSDHSSTEVGDEHLWTVRYRRGGRNWAEIVLTTKQIRLRPKIGKLDLAKTALYLPMLTAPVEFANSGPLPIPAYTLGLLIANGYCGTSSPVVTMNALDAVETAICLQADHIAFKQKAAPGSMRFAVSDMAQGLGFLDLQVKSGRKFIPLQYRRAGALDRIALLQGLMDCDGSTNGRGALCYHTTSNQLAIDVQELVEQLGGIASIRTYDRSRENKPTEYQVRLRLPQGILPFRTARKASRFNPKQLSRPCRTFLAIERSRETESVCIKIDAKDSLYCTEHCILTHNTVESALWINCVPEVKRVLVVCPASLKLNWFAELQRWLVRPTTIGLVDSSRAQAVPDTDVVIVNYEQMAKRIDTGLKIKDKKTGEFKIKYDYVLREGLRKHWDMLIVDEAHRLKGSPREVIRVRMVFAISAHREAWLSGTPMVNKVRELWNLVHRLAPKQFPDETAYLNRYCAGGSFHDKYGGGQNLAELQEKMRVFFMIRRLKKDVLKELPLKTRQVIELPVDGCRELLKQEALAFARKEEILTKQRLAVELAKASDSVEEYKRAVGALTKGIQVAFEDISRIRRETALAKIPAVVEHVSGILSEGHKVILFAYHQEVVEKLHEAFKNESVFMHGGTPTALRQVAVDKFQKDDKYRLITGTIGAMGVGYTLVASSYVVMAELDWVPGNVTQAEDRAHRIGQHDNVLVQHLVLEGSLDKRMADVIVEKQDMADRALDIESAAQLNLEPVMPERESVATQGVSQSDVAKLAEKLTADEIFAVHLSLKVLAGTHPQSRLIQGVTFREVDSALGRVLAEYGRLTPRLAALGYKFLGKYRNTALALLPEFQSLFERKKK